MAAEKNSDRYIAAFAKLEKKMNSITRRPKYVPFRTNAKIAARYNSVVKNNLEDINIFAELRNALVHNRDGNDEVMAEPSDNVTERIERLVDALQEDRKVINFARNPVVTGEASDRIEDALQKMAENKTEYMAVYGDGKFRGVFSLHQMFWHMTQNRDGKPEAISELLGDEIQERVFFVNREAILEDIVKLFDLSEADDPRLPVIIVTENGGEDETPQGMITINELAKIVTFMA